MMRPSEIRPGIRRLFRLAVRRPTETTAGVDDEIRLHIALRTQQLIREGRTPEAARLEAEARFGLPDEARGNLHHSAMRRETRFARSERLDALRQDVRYAWRGMRSNPGFAAIAALTLALGIGANTAIFSVVDAVILRSLPVHRPEQLVQITMGDVRNDEFSNPIWEALRERQDAFSGMFAFANNRFDLSRGGETRSIEGTLGERRLLRRARRPGRRGPRASRGGRPARLRAGGRAHAWLLAARVWQRPERHW